MISLITGIVGGLVKLGDKMIVDEDKRIEYAYKTQELTFNMLESLVTMRTVPWVDAFVKILSTFVVLARPLGTFAMTCLGIYGHVVGWDIPETVHLMLDGSFPAWGAAREVHKSRKHKEKISKSTIDDDEDW